MIDGRGQVAGAYVAQLDLLLPHLFGVAEKIRAQATVLQEIPARIDRYHLAGGQVVLNGTPIASVGHGKLGRRIARYYLVLRELRRRTKPLDFLFLRYQGISPLLIWTLRRLRKHNPRIIIIMEMPTWPHARPSGSFREMVFAWLERISRRNLRSHVDRILTYSRESTIFGIPTIQTDNGVDVDAISAIRHAPVDGAFRMMGLANLSFWHGYDRAVEGMARYCASGGTRDIQFDIVGTGNELPRLKYLVEQHGLADRVHFHGALRGPQLDAIAERSNVGLSSLGLHRVRVDTTNLKSREFCARGLPFVIDYTDRDFPPELPFVCTAPSDDSPLDIVAVLAFHDELVASQPHYPAEMRAFALQHLTWHKKFQPVLAYLKHSLAMRVQGDRAH